MTSNKLQNSKSIIHDVMMQSEYLNCEDLTEDLTSFVTEETILLMFANATESERQLGFRSLEISRHCIANISQINERIYLISLKNLENKNILQYDINNGFWKLVNK